jgi:subtilisin family serine protease
LWNARQLIIRFDTSAIIKPAIDKTDLEAGAITEFVKTSVLTELSNKTGFNWYKMTAYKVFRKLTTNDTISITRLGDTIKMPPFWATLSVFLPESFDEQTISDSISTLPSVCYADRNYLSCYPHQLPNDTYIGTQQESLVPTSTYPNANINIEPAWEYEQGSESIKVGVYDYPIYWAHEDFGDGTFSGSKIIDGYDYSTNSHISSVSIPTNSHGTSCAGIIGSIRNNNKGIAGIAGGDIQNNNRGVLLYSFGIWNSSYPIYVGDDNVMEAIVRGAMWNPSSPSHPGYGLHIQNHSWGGIVPYSYNFSKAVQFSWMNSCVFVASRGNDGVSDFQYPACYRDLAVLNVGVAEQTEVGKTQVMAIIGGLLPLQVM